MAKNKNIRVVVDSWGPVTLPIDESAQKTWGDVNIHRACVIHELPMSAELQPSRRRIKGPVRKTKRT